MTSIPRIIDMDTGEALPVSKGESRSGSSSNSRSKKGGNFVSNWWGGLSSDQQIGLVSTGLSVGVPLAVALGKKMYGKVKNWISKKKGASKTTKPTNQTYQGQTSINYATGGGTDAVVPYNNYTDGGSGYYGNSGETVYANPIIL